MHLYFGSHGKSQKMMALHTKFLLHFYRRGCLNYKLPRKPESQKISFFNHTVKSINVKDLHLRKQISWEEKLINKWKVGESHAYNMMKSFFSEGIKDYSEGRNFPKKKMSPDCHHISIGDKSLQTSYGTKQKKLDLRLMREILIYLRVGIRLERVFTI